MKTTKASTNATTYEEYLEQREKELQEDVEFWHRAWKDTKEECEALKARREANLKWIKTLVHSAWMLAEREGAGEEALEELEHIRDMVSYTVANMLQDDD